MTDERRQKLLLGILLVLLIFVGWRQAGRFLGGAGRSQAVGRTASGSAAGGELEAVVELRLNDLDRHRGTYEPGRSPFEFAAPPTAERPPRTERAAPPRQVSPPPSTALESAVDQLRLPPIDLVYLGNFGPADRRIAVFSDGKEIFNAMIGDVLQERFKVVGIGYESADLGYVEFPESPPARLAVGG